MSEETQPNESGTQNVDQPDLAPETPSVESLQAELAARDAKIQELGTKTSTLEKVLTERQTPQPQLQMNQPQKPAIQEIDLESEGRKIFDNVENPEEASRQFTSLLKRAETNITQAVADKMGREFHLAMQVKDNMAEIITEKPHFKGFKDEIQQKMGQFLMNNPNLDIQSVRKAVEQEYDQKLEGLKPKPKQDEPPPPPPAKGSVANTGHQPPVKEQEYKPQGYGDYMENRRMKRAGTIKNYRR